MERILLAGFLIVVLTTGLIRLVLRRRELENKKQFAEVFLGKLYEYIQSGGDDHDSYVWLTHRSPKMQLHLGVLGVARSYRAPYENYVVHNYAIIINTLPELRRALGSYLLARQAQEYADLLQECIVRHVGILDDKLEREAQSLRNPVVWFREGVQLTLAVPVLLLNWFGLIATTTVNRIINSKFFRVLSGLVALIGFAGTVIGIVTDWQSFVAIVKRVFNLR